MGNSERTLGSPRHPRQGSGLRAPLERAHGDSGGPLRGLVGHHAEQVPRLAPPLWQGQRAQRLDSARLVAGGLGEAGDRSLLLRVSAGGLPPAGVYDARPRCGGGQPVERLPRVEGGGPHRALDEQTVKEGHGLPSAAKSPRTLAYRHQLHQHPRHVLLPDDGPGRLQPLHRALGDSPLNDGARRAGGPSAGEGEVPQRERRGSSATTARSSWPRTSRSSSASVG